jgi:hypothetical protein
MPASRRRDYLDDNELEETHVNHQAKTVTWDDLVPHEKQQGGWWDYSTATDVFGNGKTFVRVENPARPWADANGRPLPWTGANTSVGTCTRCHDVVELGSLHSTRSVQAGDGRWVQVIEHLGECPPSRWCPECKLVADHAANCGRR